MEIQHVAKIFSLGFCMHALKGLNLVDVRWSQSQHPDYLHGNDIDCVSGLLFLETSLFMPECCKMQVREAVPCMLLCRYNDKRVVIS